MFFENRIYKIREVTDIDWLAKHLSCMTWCLCNGFRYSGVWFLNDAGSEDGAQEYAAIILNEAGDFIQVESITFSWCTAAEAKQYIMDCARYAYRLNKQLPMNRVVTPRFDHAVGSCSFCA